MSLPASPSCRTPVCTNSCPGTGKPPGARPWLHGPALTSRSVFEPPGPPGSDLTSRGIRRMGTPGERLRCLFAYLVRERRVSPHHDSRVISRPDLLVYIHQNILVKPRHKILVRQARASSPRAVHAGWKPALPGGPRSLEGGGPWKPALVWSAPHLQGRGCSGKQVQLHTCIRPVEREPRFPGPDGIRARLASSPRRPRMGPARAQARGMPVRPVLPSTSLLPRNCWRPLCRLESSPWGIAVEMGHAAISTACPRARAGELPKRRWAGGGNRGARSRCLHYEPFAVAA